MLLTLEPVCCRVQRNFGMEWQSSVTLEKILPFLLWQHDT